MYVYIEFIMFMYEDITKQTNARNWWNWNIELCQDNICEIARVRCFFIYLLYRFEQNIKFISNIDISWTYVWKIHHRNERQLSQNVCLINTHILIYWHSRCDCKLWNAFWFYCVLWLFSYIFDDLLL